jgi:hypothetical protein
MQVAVAQPVPGGETGERPRREVPQVGRELGRDDPITQHPEEVRKLGWCRQLVDPSRGPRQRAGQRRQPPRPPLQHRQHVRPIDALQDQPVASFHLYAFQQPWRHPGTVEQRQGRRLRAVPAEPGPVQLEDGAAVIPVVELGLPTVRERRTQRVGHATAPRKASGSSMKG